MVWRTGTGIGMGNRLFIGNVSLWMTIALVMALVQIWASYWYSDKIVLTMTGTRLVDPNQSVEAQMLYNIVEELSIAAGLPMPKVGIMETMEPNAFATGRDPDHAVVVATRGILKILNRDELAGVIAHELSHIKHRDILLTSMAATMALMISYLANLSWRMMFWGSFGDSDDRGRNPSLPSLVCF